MTIKKILITGETFNNGLIETLISNGFEIEHVKTYLKEDELIEALSDKNAYILGGVETATKKVIDSTKHLKIIAVLGVGYQSFVDSETATKKGIAITNTPNANSRAVAEMTIGLLLALRRKIPYINKLTKEGNWQDNILSKNIYGETIGIIGMGAVGSIVAEIANKGFNMKVLYNSRTKKPKIEKELGAKYLPIEQLLEESDIISLHVPLTENTKDLISDKNLNRIKKNCLIINAARPEVINSKAILNALKNSTIGGLAMDGYYVEPAPSKENDEYGLLKLTDDKLIITSHLAYLTEDSIYKMCELATQSIIEFSQGKKWKYLVNPEYVNSI